MEQRLIASQRGPTAVGVESAAAATLLLEPTPIICLERLVGSDDIEIVENHGVDVLPGLWPSVANGLATFIVALGLGLATLASAPMVIGYQPVALASGSMEPALRVGDVVVTNPSAQVAVGSIIDYRTPSGSRMHRVVEIVDNGYRTKGDSNQSPDHQIVTDEEVRGVGVFVVPFVGLPRHWFEEGQWLQLITTILLLGVCGGVLGYASRLSEVEDLDKRVAS